MSQILSQDSTGSRPARISSDNYRLSYPVLGSAILLATGAIAQVPMFTWLAAAAMGGYSLSGSV